jgi:Flp pilus assembly protein TadD
LAHNNLGVALKDEGDVDGAIRCYRTALECNPKFAYAHNNLGNALKAKGDVDGAMRCYRTAIECDPKLAAAHNGLGVALKAKGDVDGAIRCYRTAIACDPKYSQAFGTLGHALQAQGDVDGAIRCYRTAIECDPKYAWAHGTLGHALVRQGEFAEAHKETRRALDLLSARDPLRNFFSQQLKQCEQWLALDKKLPAILKGDAQPANAAERLGLAHVCKLKQLYAASARFHADAFAADPRLAKDLRTQHRYNAACYAALAAAGQGVDAGKLPDKLQARLRQQALGWLQEDLAAWKQIAGKGLVQARAAVQKTLRHWQKDPDLASVRDQAALAKLPEAERQAWQKLWADVAAVLAQARAK